MQDVNKRTRRQLDGATNKCLWAYSNNNLWSSCGPNRESKNMRHVFFWLTVYIYVLSTTLVKVPVSALKPLTPEIDVSKISHFPWHYYTVSKPPKFFSDIFPKQLGIFSPNFTCLFYVPIYAGLQSFIQLSATLTKSRHVKRDHHYMLKMSTIRWNTRWVVALNMAQLRHSLR